MTVESISEIIIGKPGVHWPIPDAFNGNYENYVSTNNDLKLNNKKINISKLERLQLNWKNSGMDSIIQVIAYKKIDGMQLLVDRYFVVRFKDVESKIFFWLTFSEDMLY
jgi:hypothetical protein